MRAALAAVTLTASPALALDDVPRGLASVVAMRQAPVLPVIGTIVPPYPDGLTSLGGACAGPPGSAAECAVGIGTLDPEGAARRSPSTRDGRPATTQRVGPSGRTNVIPVPTIPDDRFLNYSTCRTKRAGLHPVAVMRSGSGEITPESGAWTAALDRDSGRFVEIAPAAVTCENFLP